jgi:hypothetical protein
LNQNEHLKIKDMKDVEIVKFRDNIELLPGCVGIFGPVRGVVFPQETIVKKFMKISSDLPSQIVLTEKDTHKEGDSELEYINFTKNLLDHCLSKGISLFYFQEPNTNVPNYYGSIAWMEFGYAMQHHQTFGSMVVAYFSRGHSLRSYVDTVYSGSDGLTPHVFITDSIDDAVSKCIGLSKIDRSRYAESVLDKKSVYDQNLPKEHLHS